MGKEQHTQAFSRSVFRFRLSLMWPVGNALDNAVFAVINATCVQNLKNGSSLDRMEMGREVAFLQQAVVDLDRAIALGRGT